MLGIGYLRLISDNILMPVFYDAGDRVLEREADP
jgi:hypothetical protein